MKNENKTDEMVDILDDLQKYVPSERTTKEFLIAPGKVFSLQLDHFSHVLLGGDQLTVARICGAQRIRRNSYNGQDRVEGLVPVVEDWHAKVCFLKVLFCSNSSYSLLVIHCYHAPYHVDCVDTTVQDKFKYGWWHAVPVKEPDKPEKCCV